MEFAGHHRSIMFLLTTSMIIKEYITDRHTSITKWMREECPNICKEMGKCKIDHFFDLWHIAKSKQWNVKQNIGSTHCSLIYFLLIVCFDHLRNTENNTQTKQRAWLWVSWSLAQGLCQPLLLGSYFNTCTPWRG